MLSKEKLIELTEDILINIERKGIDKLIKFLKESDYYTAPASTNGHGNFVGGLAEHSLNVRWLLHQKVGHNPYINVNINLDSADLVPIAHDVCKVNHYVRKKKHWEVKDKIPLGHGPKSLAIVLQLGLELTTEEMLAIRWHMGPRTPSTHMGWPDASDYKRAVKQTPLVTLLCTADMEASQVIER